MKKGIFLALLIITALAANEQPKLKQKVFVFTTQIPQDYSIADQMTANEKKIERQAKLAANPQRPQQRIPNPPPNPPNPPNPPRPSGEVAINRPQHPVQYISENKPQPRNQVIDPSLTLLAQAQKNKKKSQKHPQFQQFKKINFNAARTYKVNNINDQSVLDAQGRLVPTSLLPTTTTIKYNEIIPQKQQSIIRQPRPRFPQPQPNLRQNIPGIPSIPANKPWPQTPIQYQKDPGIKPKITRTDESSISQQKNILKIIFTIMLGISALVIVFGYKPEQRNVGPYIPTNDDQQSRLR